MVYLFFEIMAQSSRDEMKNQTLRYAQKSLKVPQIG